MFKDILKRQQPVVYHTLKNALEQDKIAHAYMFSGPNGTPKKETAYLLSQSLVCSRNGFACETCEVCKRIEKNEFADMIYMDGSVNSIKKDDIIKLQHVFNKTSLESYGKKVYIIDHAENATPDALNSLLKFLEEPSGNMTAILIVEQLDRVLATIVSRCQLIPFTALNAKQCYEAVKPKLDELDAYLLSHMIRQESAILEAAESDDYQHAMYMFKGTIERYVNSSYQALLFLQIEGFPAKQKKYGKQALIYLLDMMHIFFKDCMKNQHIVRDEWYERHIQIMCNKQVDYIKLLRVFMESKDKLLRSVNIQLLVDQILYRMKEVK